MDYYKTLGVKSHAADKEIKASYRKLAKQYHPDAAGDDPVKARRMYEIQEAYDALSDPEKRTAYDARRESGALGAAPGAYGGAEQSPGNGHGPKAGQPGRPAPDMNRFEPFFGFRPGKGMETRRNESSGSEKPEGPVKPEEMFASFFGKIKRQEVGKANGGKAKSKSNL